MQEFKDRRREIIEALNTIKTLEQIVNAVEPFEDSKFIPAKESFIYVEPLKVERSIASLLGEYSTQTGEITNLNQLEQAFLLSKLGDRIGMKLRLPSLEEAYIANRDEKFRRNVLEGKNVYTRLLALKMDGDLEVREIEEVHPLINMLTIPNWKSPLAYVAEKVVGKSIASNSGFFKGFEVVPKNSDLSKIVPRDPKAGYWVETSFDENGYAAIGCKSSGGTFTAYAIGPLQILSNRVVAISTPEKPKR